MKTGEADMRELHAQVWWTSIPAQALHHHQQISRAVDSNSTCSLGSITVSTLTFSFHIQVNMYDRTSARILISVQELQEAYQGYSFCSHLRHNCCCVGASMNSSFTFTVWHSLHSVNSCFVTHSTSHAFLLLSLTQAPWSCSSLPAYHIHIQDVRKFGLAFQSNVWLA